MKLKDIETNEISLVDEPATKKKFLFFKRGISKGDTNMDTEILTLLNEFFGEEKIDFEKKAGELDDAAITDIKAALKTINQYKADFPDDLKTAVGDLAKIVGKLTGGGYGYPPKEEEKKKGVEKSGAKFSKDTMEKLKKAVEALEALKTILPDLKEEDVEKKSDVEKRIEDLTKTIESLEKKKEDGKGDEDASVKALESLTKRLEIVEKSTGVKKSVEGQDDNDDDEDIGEKKWPSISVKK